MTQAFSKKQMQFIAESTAKWNLAHGSVRTGKTICTLFRFMQACFECPDSQIWMVGHSADTIYTNAIRLLLESEELAYFRPFCTWQPGKRQLKFMDKTISTLGARDAGAIGAFQGKTFSLVYCDEITLYPETIIDMIDTRLSKPYSMGFASMNPSHPKHKVKQWIDKAEAGDPNYYSLHFTLDDNPYVDDDYKLRIKNSLSGLFYKRNYLGLWCLAEGAVFDFFDTSIHVVSQAPRAADYWIAAIDYGAVNPFACLIIGVSTGMYTQTGKCLWVEKEYFWDPKKKGRQKTNSQFAEDIEAFLEPYGVQKVYIDPSAAAMSLELRRRGIACIGANNDVAEGIQTVANEMAAGNLYICAECTNLIREIETYSWDTKAAEQGKDEPLKRDDHCFEGYTEISTRSGLKYIKDILPGHQVLTSQGFKTVERCGITMKFVYRFDLYGNWITCTPDHRFYTLDGWKQISELIRSDILIQVKDKWENGEMLRLLSIKEDGIEDIQNLPSRLSEITTVGMENITIETCGKPRTGKYPKDIIFITSTKTPLIMICPISSALIQKHIRSVIKMIIDHPDLQNILPDELLNGIEAKKEKSGTKSTQKRQASGKTHLGVCSASSAEKVIRPSSNPMQSFVRITVDLNSGENLVLMMSKQLVQNVEKFLQKTSIQEKNIALANVDTQSGQTIPVYNLDVEGAHEFFAEGFLVHNSVDALRYAIHTHKVTTYDPYKDDQRAKEFRANRFQFTPSFR